MSVEKLIFEKAAPAMSVYERASYGRDSSRPGGLT
jgi:hypothetical protein